MTTQRYEPAKRHSITCVNCGFQSCCVPEGHNLSDADVDRVVQWSWEDHWGNHPGCKAVYDEITGAVWQKHYRTGDGPWDKTHVLRHGVQMVFAT